MAFTFPTMHWEEVFWPGSCSCLWRFAQTYDISRVFQTDELQESSIPNWFCCIQLSYPTGNYFCSCFMQNHQHLFKLMLNLVDFVRHSRHSADISWCLSIRTSGKFDLFLNQSLYFCDWLKVSSSLYKESCEGEILVTFSCILIVWLVLDYVRISDTIFVSCHSNQRNQQFSSLW